MQLQRTASGRSAVLYLADADIARQAIITYNTLFGLGLGVTALMGLYALPFTGTSAARPIWPGLRPTRRCSRYGALAS